MKIQKSNYSGIQKNAGKAAKKEMTGQKDEVILGGTPNRPDFLKMGDLASLKSSDSSNASDTGLYAIGAGAVGFMAGLFHTGSLLGAVAGGALGVATVVLVTNFSKNMNREFDQAFPDLTGLD